MVEKGGNVECAKYRNRIRLTGKSVLHDESFVFFLHISETYEGTIDVVAETPEHGKRMTISIA